MKTVYAVLRIDSSMVVCGQDAKLPKGNYVMPLFDNEEDAKEAAGDRFEIIKMSTKD